MQQEFDSCGARHGGAAVVLTTCVARGWQGKDGRKDNGSNGFGSPGSVDNGLVVELPDGKLFKLSNPNGRVVEMPNGSVVEMIDGQVRRR